MKASFKFLPVFASALLLAAPLMVRAADEVAGTPVQNADMPPPPPHEGGPGGPGGPRGGGMMERAAKELGLTADQQAKWKAIGEQERTALEALRDDTSVEKKDKRAKMMEINKGFADQRRAVLTADQQVKFDELRAKMMERGGKGGPGGKKKKDN